MHVSSAGPKTSVSVISDSRLFREAIRSWLQRHDDIQFVAAAGSLQQLRQRYEPLSAQVLLVRARSDMLGRELRYELRLLFPAARLIVLQAENGKHDLVRWIEAGAVDYLHQNASPIELLQCIREAARDCPRCSMSRHTRAIGATGQTVYRAAYGDSGSTVAEAVAERTLHSSTRLLSGQTHDSPAGRRRGKSARKYDSSIVPNQ